jgi:hypothetical protein
MNAAALLTEARRLGACLAANGERLLAEAPAPLPDTLVAELRAHKHELLAMLTSMNNVDRDAVTEWWQERAAIMEHDGGLSREEAERQAGWRTLARFGLPTSYTFH